MSISKSEAIIMLAISAGNADGEFSFQEISDTLTKIPVIREAITESEKNNWTSKIRLGELTVDSALKALNKLSIDDKTEAMAICLAIVMSDGVIKEEPDILEYLWG